MTITVNDESCEVPEGATVRELLELLRLTTPCAVEVDRSLVPKARHDEQRLTAGARVEIVTLVGGG